AAFLAEPGHVDDAPTLALKVRGHAEDRPDGDDASAPDAGDDHAVVGPYRGQAGLGQRRQRLGFGDGLRLAQFGAVNRDKRRAETFQATEILVAARLIDAPFAAEFGLEWLHRHAVRLHAAIPAALTDERVDDDALVGIRIEPALAPPAFLGRAGLIVDQHAQAFHRSEFG